jgi:hypothetical protein
MLLRSFTHDIIMIRTIRVRGMVMAKKIHNLLLAAWSQVVRQSKNGIVRNAYYIQSFSLIDKCAYLQLPQYLGQISR